MTKPVFWLTLSAIFCAASLLLVVQQSRVDNALEQLGKRAKLFSPQLVESQLPHVPAWELRKSANHDRFCYVAAQQGWLWAGKGQNAIIFESPDHRYVAKFLQVSLKHLPEQPLLARLFRSDDPQWYISQFDAPFLSAKICFEKLAEETGVVYAHLNRTERKIHGLVVRDYYGQQHRLDGDTTCFVLQEKAMPVITELSSLMSAGKEEEAKRRISQLISLLLSLAKKGYVDGKDGLFTHNSIGYTKDRAIYMDTWHFFKAGELHVERRMQYEFAVRLKPLEQWLQASHASLARHYDQQRASTLQSLQAT